MQVKHCKPYLFWVIFCEAIGALAGILTKEGISAYESLQKPVLTPPSLVFPIVWSILFFLMGIGAARIWIVRGGGWKKAFSFFFLQLAMNVGWSLIFFLLGSFGLALIWLIGLWLAILCMVILFWRIDRPAAWLQIPYLLWVAFAGYLNYGIWQLN